MREGLCGQDAGWPPGRGTALREVSGMARATVVALWSLQFTARLPAAGNGAGKKEELNVARSDGPQGCPHPGPQNLGLGYLPGKKGLCRCDEGCRPA